MFQLKFGGASRVETYMCCFFATKKGVILRKIKYTSCPAEKKTRGEWVHFNVAVRDVKRGAMVRSSIKCLNTLPPIVHENLRGPPPKPPWNCQEIAGFIKGLLCDQPVVNNPLRDDYAIISKRAIFSEPWLLGNQWKPYLACPGDFCSTENRSANAFSLKRSAKRMAWFCWCCSRTKVVEGANIVILIGRWNDARLNDRHVANESGQGVVLPRFPGIWPFASLYG